MNETAAPVEELAQEQVAPDIDALLVKSVVRWALVLTGLVLLLDLAALDGWPAPSVLGALRAPFYVLLIVSVAAGTIFICFLGYRLVSMRVVTHTRTLAVIYLPVVAILSSVIAFLLLTAPK